MATLTAAEKKYLYSKGVDANKASQNNINIAKAYTASQNTPKTTAPVKETKLTDLLMNRGTGTTGVSGTTTSNTASANKTEKDQYSTIRDAFGNLTDYGQSLERQNVNYAGQSTPSGYNANAGSLYGGLTPTYEMYAGNAQANGQAFADRATWENMMKEKGVSYMSGTGGTETLVTGTGAVSTGTSVANTNITALRQQQIDALRAKLGIQKAASQSSILSDADRAKQAVNTAYQQSIAGQKESLVNQGLAGGVGGNDQSGIARTQMLQGQLAAENQQNAIGVQASADVNALETQYNTLLAQGESEAAQQLIDDAYKQQQADLENQRYAQQYNDLAKQYADTIAARNQTQANYEADRKYQQEQDIIQSQIDADTLEYNRARQAEQDAQDLWYKQQQIKAKTAAQKLAEKKAQQAYETAKAKTAIANTKLQNSVRKKGSSSGKGSSSSKGSSGSSGSSGIKTDASGLSIFG